MLIPKEVDYRCTEFNWNRYHEFQYRHTPDELKELELQNVFAEKFNQIPKQMIGKKKRLLCNIGIHEWLKVETLFTKDQWYKICLNPDCVALYLYTDLSSHEMDDVVRTRIIISHDLELYIHKCVRDKYAEELQEIKKIEEYTSDILKVKVDEFLTVYKNDQDVIGDITLDNIKYINTVPKGYCSIRHKGRRIATFYLDQNKIIVHDYAFKCSLKNTDLKHITRYQILEFKE